MRFIARYFVFGGMLIAYRIRCLIKNNDFPKVVIIFLFVFGLALSENIKSFLFFVLLVSMDPSHSISRQRLRKLPQEFNMCDFVASLQAFVAKAGIDCDHWCPYIVRH